MKILITGSKGFIGRNLIERLHSINSSFEIVEFDINNSIDELDNFCKDCDFVYNFAAVHRPLDNSEFLKTNYNQFDTLLKFLDKHNNKCPVLYTSSIQSNNGSAYGESKYLAEQALLNYGKKNDTRSIVYRLTNIFGKWARPNSHSVVATFCYNVIHDIPLTISNPNIIMHFNYIDDVIDSFIERLYEGKNRIKTDDDIYSINSSKMIDISLGDLATLIESFKDSSYCPKNKIEELFYLTYNSYKENETL